MGTGCCKRCHNNSFPVAGTIPVFNNVYYATASVEDNNAGVDSDLAIRVDTFTVLDITVYGSTRTAVGAAATNFTYLIIGD